MSPNDYTHEPQSKNIMIVRSPRQLAHLIRDVRKQRLLTQAQLAEHVGVSRKWVIDLEGGKPTADLSLVLRTLNSLGLQLDVGDRTSHSESGGRREIIDGIVEASRKRKP